VFGVPAGCLVLLMVSLLTPPPGRAELAMVDALRLPGPLPEGPGRSGPPSAL
jgi:cation/acetate symporter